MELVSLITIPKAKKLELLWTVEPNGTSAPTTGWPIRTVDGKTVQAIRPGDIKITLLNGKKESTVILKDALCTPDLAFTLISIICLLKIGCGVNFFGNMCITRYPNEQVMATIPESMGLLW